MLVRGKGGTCQEEGGEEHMSGQGRGGTQHVGTREGKNTCQDEGGEEHMSG